MPQGGRLVLALAVAFGLAAVLAVPANAQVLYGSMVGTVEDPTGAVVPKATVTATNTGMAQSIEVTTDDQGRFTFVNLLPSKYDLKVVATGFKPFTVTGIDISVNVVTRHDVKLEVGALTESVSIVASAAQLQTDKTEVRHSITTTALSQIPLPNQYRNYQVLLNLVPGATPAAFQNAVVDTPSRSLRSSVNGTAVNNNNTLVDGAANTFIWLPHHTYYVPSSDSISEVNISTGSFDAEQGMAGGAAITVMTKSGTNEIHGTATWYHMNQHFKSDDVYFRGSSYKKPLNILNQPNATVGGAIKKDKLFYFLSYERTAERTGNSGNYSVPPADFRRGDFSNWTALATIYDPASSSDPKTRKPFPNNIIPPERINKTFTNIVNQLPMPNQVSPTDTTWNLGGTYFKSGVLKLDRHLADLKMNYNPTSKLAIWGKMSYLTAPVQGKYVFDNLGGDALGTEGIGDTKTYVPTIGFTYTLSPTFLFDGLLGITRFDQAVNIPGLDKNGGLDTWKIPGTNGGTQYANDIKHYGSLPCITSYGFTNIGYCATWTPVERHERTYEDRTNFTNIRGPHELRWGFNSRRYQMTHWQPETQNPRGEIDFGGGPTILYGGTSRTSNQYAAALLGLVNSYYKSIQYLLMQDREWQLSWYAQDRWQVNRKLTLVLGLRYEYFPLINRGDRGIERWDPYTNNVYMGGFGKTPWNAAAPDGSGGITVSKKLFAPRVGFAYRLGDDTVIRAGYGIAYDPLPFSRPLRGLYPATLTGSWGTGTAGAAMQNTSYGWYNTLDQGIPPVPTPDTSTGVTQLPLNLDMGLMSPWGGELHRGYIQSWNFTIERKLPMDAIASIAYVGTRTIHQMLYRNINTDYPGEDVNSRNRYLAKLWGQPKTNSMYMWDGIGYGAYNGLQAALNKNLTRGLFVKMAYTWSKAMSMGDEDGWQQVAKWNTPEYLARNYAPNAWDRTHMFTTAWVYQIPVGKGKTVDVSSKVLDHIVGGWQISGMFSAYSGTTFGSAGSSSSLLSRGNDQTADLIAPVKKIDTERGPGKPYYDPGSFMDPLVFFNQTGAYRFGTTGRNFLRGPGFWRFDPAIYKTFKVTERISSEFRAESFNFTNTPVWNNPNSSSSGPIRDSAGNITKLNDFMCITGATAGRQFRFAARITF